MKPIHFPTNHLRSNIEAFSKNQISGLKSFRENRKKNRIDSMTPDLMQPRLYLFFFFLLANLKSSSLGDTRIVIYGGLAGILHKDYRVMKEGGV
jgi:hypothetical protein